MIDASKRSSQDRSIHGYKSMLKEEPVTATSLADRIIENTYRTLMSRGQKGRDIFSADAETNEYFRQFVDYDACDAAGDTSWPEAAEPELADDSQARRA